MNKIMTTCFSAVAFCGAATGASANLIVLCVHWYLRFTFSFLDLVEMMVERVLTVAHATIMRWVGDRGDESAPQCGARGPEHGITVTNVCTFCFHAGRRAHDCGFTASTNYPTHQASTIGTQMAYNVRVSTGHFTTGFGDGVPNHMYGS